MFNGVYLRNNLPKTKDGAYAINLDEFKSTGTLWIALYVHGIIEAHLAMQWSFGVNHIPKEISKIIGNKNIITIIYRTQETDLIMSGYFCVGFIDIMLNDKIVLDYANLFSPNEYEKNDKMILISH